MSFKSFSLAAIALAGVFGAAGAASAMPVMPVGALHSESGVEQVRYGCPPGLRRGEFGRCVRPSRVGAPHAYHHRPMHHGRHMGHGPRWHHRY